MTMMKLVVSAVVVVLLAGCGTKVQQQKPPRIEDDDATSALSGETDMAAEPTELVPVEEKKVTPEEQKGMCCAECANAAANDRSGDDPTKVPCVDFTADLGKKCLMWFRSHAMMASDAPSCATKAAPPKPQMPTTSAAAPAGE